ncbi:uncharacterized protein [Cherax quadricarinatus]|uniref:uncharacterized protein n=1 Tax=Cherax quadricarinatus TaxID=27406 RepID=UPI00387E5497
MLLQCVGKGALALEEEEEEEEEEDERGGAEGRRQLVRAENTTSCGPSLLWQPREVAATTTCPRITRFRNTTCRNTTCRNTTCPTIDENCNLECEGDSGVSEGSSASSSLAGSRKSSASSICSSRKSSTSSCSSRKSSTSSFSSSRKSSASSIGCSRDAATSSSSPSTMSDSEVSLESHNNNEVLAKPDPSADDLKLLAALEEANRHESRCLTHLPLSRPPPDFLKKK